MGIRKCLASAVIATLSAITQGVLAQPGYSVLPLEPLDTVRVGEISAMLSESPAGFGDPIQLREHWDRLYRTGQFDMLIHEADSISAMPFPALTESIYMGYYEGTDSETSKRFIANRRLLLAKLVWAECLVDRGKYLPAISHAVNDILHTVSWAFPAEDRSKTNYYGTGYTIGLSSAAYGFDLAQTLYLLNDRLGPVLQGQVLDALRLKVFNPTLRALENNNNGEYPWLTNTTNYNSVTLACITGAALAILEDRWERAKFVAIAERYSHNFLVGYSDDGYCSEGVDYYAFGFGHYLLLREHIWQATQGKIDLLQRPKINEMAVFVPRMEIINGVYPAISDSKQYIKPDGTVMHYLNKAFGMGMGAYRDLRFSDIQRFALSQLMHFFPNSTSTGPPVASLSPQVGLRSYFDRAGVLIVRPFPAIGGIGAAFKGGNNKEHHNHNDLGSFTIVVGNELLMGDAGSATYTPKYFGRERYDLFKTTASYGHPVPLVAECEQRNGIDAHARILRADFTDRQDRLVMDLASGYAVPGLRGLTRTFTYHRGGQAGQVEVKDEFAFASDRTFETALITRYGWQRVSEEEIAINGRSHVLRVRIHAAGNRIELKEEVIDEGPAPYTRIAIRLVNPSASGSLTMTFYADTP